MPCQRFTFRSAALRRGGLVVVGACAALVFATPTSAVPHDTGTADLAILRPIAARPFYYVARTGCSDSFPGSAAQPWCTIARAAAVMEPGDTVIVRAGRYNESITPRTGAPGAYITYQGQPGAILDGTGSSAQAFDLNTVAYLNISGFEITNYKTPRPAGNSVNIRGTAHDISLSNLLVHDNWNGIIMQDDASRITISTSTVSKSRYGVGFEDRVHDIVIDGVVSHDNSELYIGPVSSYQNGDGFSADPGTYNLTITNSAAYDNQDAGFDVRAVNLVCANCISHSNAKYGFRLWEPGGPFTVINGLAYRNGWYPLNLENRGLATTYLYNSTFVGRPGDSGYMIDGSGGNFIFRNTIFAGFARRVSNQRLTRINDDYNLYFSPTGTVEYALGPHSLRSNPLFVDSAADDYHLQSSSRGIDGGTTLSQVTIDLDDIPRPQGRAYDIGAYEDQRHRPCR